MTKQSKNKKVVVLGGGTGNFTMLTGLKKHPLDISVIVSMVDTGGSTGVLRDELGVLPPGDIRQCLVALSRSDEVMRELMNYRFASGNLKGHNFGNLFLSALEKSTGSFDKAIEVASEILRIDGRVIPATLEDVQLVAYLEDGKVVRGEHTIEYQDLKNLKKIVIEPGIKANPKAVKAILDADVVVISPGDFYQSIIPNLLVRGIPEAITKSKAKTIFMCNLMTKAVHTDGYSVADFTRRIEFYMKGRVDFVIYNNKKPSTKLITRYAKKGERPVKVGKDLPKSKFIGGDLVSKKIAKQTKGDLLKRNFIRHDSEKVAKIIVSLL
ncbi:MAG: hypothetical protein UX16_C0008G0012 [Parcubacteria group bacterium GW2011_GWB1_45_7]|nr:MAG: hypothetical protein UX16_C0008G0012 [Parcubacteria group bacterium GW2011_GWB1_45_7]